MGSFGCMWVALAGLIVALAEGIAFAVEAAFAVEVALAREVAFAVCSSGCKSSCYYFFYS